MIVIVFGLPGSGKSYFASRFAKAINIGYINSDRLRREMFAERTYSEQEKTAVYNVMLLKMKDAVSQNRSLILDATFHNKKIRETFVREMEGKGGICFIEVTTNEDITRERLKKERPFSEADFKVYKLIQHEWEPMSESHLVLESTNENIDHMLQKAAQYLERKNDKRTDQ